MNFCAIICLQLTAHPTRSERVGMLQVHLIKQNYLPGSMECIFSVKAPTLWNNKHPQY